MQPAFRWYGASDRVPLSWIKQMTPEPLVVTHLPNVEIGVAWPLQDIRDLRGNLDRFELKLGPIESVFWSDDMKLGGAQRDRHIENYFETLANLREIFPEPDELIVTYNLMPLDWGRTSLSFSHPNGSRGLAYDHDATLGFDLSRDLFLPGWSRAYRSQEFSSLQQAYAEQGRECFWKNVKYVLDAIIPMASALDIRLAAHPNDPPWSYLGLPAYLCNASDVRQLLSLHPHRSNAICFCTGSYGAEPSNDVLAMIQEFCDSIAWMHLRTVKTTAEKCFHEADHADVEANLDLLEVIESIAEAGWDGVFRSDHGLDLLHETDTGTNGYPVIDRYAANKMLWAYDRAVRSLRNVRLGMP